MGSLYGEGARMSGHIWHHAHAICDCSSWWDLMLLCIPWNLPLHRVKLDMLASFKRLRRPHADQANEHIKTKGCAVQLPCSLLQSW